MATSTTSTRPARRPSSAPAEILQATEELLLQDGAEGLSIRKLSQRCGYTAPTIYHHFGDKRGLLIALIDERFRVTYEVMRSIPRGPDPAHYLREMASAFIRFALDNPDHYRLLSTPGLDVADAVPSAEAARELVKRPLEELARAGTLATSDVEAAYQVTWATIHGLISLHYLRPDYPFSEALPGLTLDMIEAGLLRKGGPS